MQFDTKDIVMLTGAGFSKNFGGFLASEMWEMIFNNPATTANDQIRKMMLEDYDFESVYATVMKSESLKRESLFQDVVLEAYRKLDDSIRGKLIHAGLESGIGSNLFSKILCGTGKKKGIIFTLNQDLLMERRYNYRSPGVDKFASRHDNGSWGQELRENDFITLPTGDVASRADGEIETTEGIVYIKLHGSYGWRSSDGRSQMVLGHDKEGDILREPILNYYFDLFKSVIASGNKKLLIVGYGFGDIHINKILVDGVVNHGLKIYIIAHSSMGDLRRRIENGHCYARPMLEGIFGYFTQPLSAIFPAMDNSSPYLREFQKVLLA